MMRKKSFVHPLYWTAVAAMPLFGCTSSRTVGDRIDDSAITAAVKTRLTTNLDTSAHEIDVDTLNGNVRLSGVVDSQDERSEAGRVARRTHGVRSVDNELTVGSKTVGTVIDDKVLVARVKAALIGDETVSAAEIDVDVDNGVVTLSGEVGSWTEKSRAARVARSVEGVRGVRDLLIVG